MRVRDKARVGEKAFPSEAPGQLEAVKSPLHDRRNLGLFETAGQEPAAEETNRRTGNHIFVNGSWVPRDAAVTVASGDLNGDGGLDLILGWDTFGSGDYNLRVLFANNF